MLILNHIAAYLEESNFMNIERHGTGQGISNA
jgi:hypothetical protein